jgi:hypothetical protein
MNGVPIQLAIQEKKMPGFAGFVFKQLPAEMLQMHCGQWQEPVGGKRCYG